MPASSNFCRSGRVAPVAAYTALIHTGFGSRCKNSTIWERREGGRTAAEQAEAFARQLLLRWGVVFRDAASREPVAPAWRDLLVALRRMESRGEIRGGRFVDAFAGEQFALPEALDLLRALRRTGETADPPEGPGPWAALPVHLDRAGA